MENGLTFCNASYSNCILLINRLYNDTQSMTVEKSSCIKSYIMPLLPSSTGLTVTSQDLPGVVCKITDCVLS